MTYAITFDHAPDANPDTHTSTLTMRCCGEVMGSVTSGPANGAGGSVTNWVRQSVDITTHMTTQPKADHYPAWAWSSGSDASYVRNLRIESSGGGSWPDQYGTTTVSVGADGTGSALQKDPGNVTGPSLSSGSFVDHVVLGTDGGGSYPAVRLLFDIAPDTDVPGNGVANFFRQDEPGGSWTLIRAFTTGETKPYAAGYSWESRGVALPSRVYAVRYQYTSGQDSVHIRNVRLVDASDSVISYDQFVRQDVAWLDQRTGVDGSAAAQQPDPSETPPGTFASTADGYVSHFFEMPALVLGYLTLN